MNKYYNLYKIMKIRGHCVNVKAMLNTQNNNLGKENMNEKQQEFETFFLLFYYYYYYYFFGVTVRKREREREIWIVWWVKSEGRENERYLDKIVKKSGERKQGTKEGRRRSWNGMNLWVRSNTSMWTIK